MGFLSVLSMAHALVEDRVRKGETVVDATVGNGVDTLRLARVVGSQGRVYGLDIQQAALDAARRRIDAESGDNAGSVELTLRGHEAMEAVLPPPLHGTVGAVMFNLGYLPGAEGELVVTHVDTTLPALEAALRVLRPGGLVTVVLYPGHEGGDVEANAVESWAKELPQVQYQVMMYRFMNRKTSAPYLIAIDKR
ncbi:class I SAM-dependent methyltransferase [Paenibacillus sp. KN14-4R]|uniref:tRNA (mnm(5)s(2)U34)-methyltransferase n=1 Tax=Paenibacillus sp. KN14-4R TaxID=3445773 RepID=UPI003FA0FB8C